MEPNQNMEQQPVGGYQNLNIPQKPERKTGLAVASLILGLLSLFGLCCCGINIVTAPLAIIFGIVSLAKKRDGTGLAITGIVTAVLSIVMILGVVFAFRDILPYSDTIVQDYMQVIVDQDAVFTAYEADGTLPDYLEKYKEPPYSDFLAKYDADIYDVMDVLLEQYESGELSMPGGVEMALSSGDFSDMMSELSEEAAEGAA